MEISPTRQLSNPTLNQWRFPRPKTFSHYNTFLTRHVSNWTFLRPYFLTVLFTMLWKEKLYLNSTMASKVEKDNE